MAARMLAMQQLPGTCLVRWLAGALRACSYYLAVYTSACGSCSELVVALQWLTEPCNKQ